MLFKIHFLKSLARYTHLKMIKNTCNGKNRLQEINDNDECYSIEEEKEETSNNDNTTNNSNISNNGNSSNNSGSSSNTKPTQPTKPSSVQPTIENVKSKVASLGWTYNKDDYEQYKCYKDEVSMGG